MFVTTSLTPFRRPFDAIRVKHPRISSSTSAVSPRSHPPSASYQPKPKLRSAINRKSFLRITALAALSAVPLRTKVEAETQFSTYRGPVALGFSFSYPSSWTIAKKPIKTHLSEVIVSSNDQLSTSAGLVVDAVKIGAIDSFGTPEAVAQKVVNVEKKKDSVTDAFVQSARTVTNDALTYYVIDYVVDSTRGKKRYIAKATVTGNQLYVFTAQAKVDAFDGETADLLLRMLDSFNVVKQYS